MPTLRNALDRIDWILTEDRHAKELIASGVDPKKLLLANEPPNSNYDSTITELRVWAPTSDKLFRIPRRLAALSRLQCLAIGPGIDPKALSCLEQSLIPDTVTALGVFTGGVPASWPADVHLPNLTDLRTDGPLNFSHANFPKLRAVSLYPTRNGKNFDAILECKDLQELQLLTVQGPEVFARIKHLPLVQLGLLGGKLNTLEGVESLQGIKWLRLHNLRWLTLVSPIKGLKKLEELEVRYCKQIEDITSLSELHQLRRLEVVACGNLGLKKIQTFLDKLEDVMISASS